MKRILYPFLLIISLILCHCQSKQQTNDQYADGRYTVADSLAIREAFSSSPVLSPAVSMESMQVAEGFEVKLVAAEPLVSTPIALTFDYEGRIWVLEMDGYMPDIAGSGEDAPKGKIAILEDKNGDGVMDERKVFLDSLVLPRAICLIDNGILVAEPPNLWYYEIHHDQPGERVLVDGNYADGGNVEHQPNGLLRAMDNWIYNAKSSKRYQKRGNRWVIEQTHFRGQWGIAQDNYGRLYYNDNSTNLRGDYFTPGLGANNENQHGVAGYRERIVADNSVYPARPTPGVNRGYMEGILDDSLRLVNFTAACGPVIYRGGLFGKDYAYNGFVAGPAANLIKRNTLKKKGYLIQGMQAYEGKEFLASTDERFRPVNLYNGPDGALYVVDMYRGIIQHKTYLTPYLKREIQRRKLAQPLSCGRIYKIVPSDKDTKSVHIPKDPIKLVKLLGHSNGWVRDNAQQMLIDNEFTQAIPALRKALKETSRPLLVMHALWTLEGLEALRRDEVLSLLKQSFWPIRMQALSVLPAVMNKANYKHYVPVLEYMVEQNDALSAPYIAFLAHYIRDFDKVAGNDLLYKVVKRYPDSKYVADAVISSIQGSEEIFQKEVTAFVSDTALTINRELQEIVTNIKEAQANRDLEALRKSFPKGAALFTSICQTCHGKDGNGVPSLAPPLNQSEWVTGNKDKLISIVLFGLSGPVKVNGHLYRSPEINGDMPGIGYNKDLSNEEVAELLSFIRKSWKNNASTVNVEEVAAVRQQLKDREEAFTIEELNER